MLTKHDKIYLLLIVLFLSGTLFAQWSQHNGPRGRINILYADNDIVFSYIDSSRIYKTSPGSNNWVEAHNGISNEFYVQNQKIVKAGDMFLLATTSGAVQGSNNTIFITNDDGNNWQQTSLSLPYTINYMAYIDSTIFAASNTSSGSPLHYSSDQGVTWQECNGMVANGLTSMLKHDSKIYASTNLGVFVSVDKGVNWVKKNSEGIPTYGRFSLMLSGFGADSNKIYGLMRQNPSLSSYYSIDEGNTWTEVKSTGLPGGGGDFFYTTPELSTETIYMLVTQDNPINLPTIYTSNDYGVTWTQLGIPPFNSAYDIAIGGGVIYAETAVGLLKSDNWAVSWADFSNGIIYNGNTRGFAVANGTLFTTIARKLAKIGAYPGEWLPVAVPDSIISSYSLLSFNNILFLYAYSGLVKSEDAGNTWMNIWGNLPSGFKLSSANAGDTKIYLGGTLNSKSVLLTSSNMGNTWSSTEMPVSYFSTMVAAGNTVYMKSNDKLYKTMNDGASWVTLGTSGISDPSRINTYTESNGTVIVYVWDVDNPQVFYSENGTSWSSTTGLGNNNPVNSFMVDNNIVFAATKNGVFISEDDGKTWISKSEGIGSRDVQEVFSQGKYYVASVWDRAVWFIAKPKITSIEKSNSAIPESFELQQNYPNPFNPTTTISYAIPNSGFVQLKVYDVLGSEVAVLVNKEQLLGNYKVEFNASSLSSGIYFYKLQSGNFSITKKLILLK